MLNPQLYIEGERVEMFEDENVSMTSSVVNLKDISKIFTDFTKSFTVPASPANNKIFQHWYKAEIEGGFNANLRKNATMELNLQPFKTGKIQLNKVQKKNGVAVNYQLQFFGDVVQLTDAFGEDLLTDLDLSDYSHAFDSDNVMNSSFVAGLSLLSLDVIYPMISFNRVWTMGDSSTTDIRFSTKIADSGIYWDELKPAIRLQRIIDAISLKYGLTFSDHFFNSTDFLKLYLLANKEKGLMTPFGEPVLMEYDGTGTFAGQDDESWFTILGTWTHGQVIAEFVPDSGYEEVEYSITKVVNGVEYPPETHTGNSSAAVFQQGGSGEDDLQVGFYISASQSFHFTSDVNLLDVPTAKYEGSATTQSLTGYVYFTDEEVGGITQLGELPEMKVVDFFRGLTQMFNLVVVPDGNQFIVQSLDDWYAAGTTKDFSKYIDLAEEDVNRTDLYKVINFTYQEPETIIQVEFEDTNDRYYGNLEYESDVDGDTFEIELPFENLVGGLMSDDTDGLTNVRVSYVLDKDSEEIKAKPMIFYNAGQETSTEPLCFEEDDGTQTEVFKYRNLGQENDLTSSLITHSLNWGGEVSTNTLGITENSLFADYWSTYITDIFDENRRMFKFSGIIPSGVLSTLKLNDKLIINGRRYIINQYTANLKTGKVDFELLNDVLELDAVETNNDGLQYELQTGLTG